MTEPAEAVQGFWKTVFTKPVLSWALYDLANTIFSMNIVSLYLALWVLDMGWDRRDLGVCEQSRHAPGLRQCPDPRGRSPTKQAGVCRSSSCAPSLV